MIKKGLFLLLFTTAFTGVFFTACSKISNEKRVKELNDWVRVSNDKLKVLSTTAIIDDIIGIIGGDDINHMPLISGQLDPHSYELIKGDGEKLEYADVIFYNGLDLEHGATVKARLKKSDKAFALSDFIQNQSKKEDIFIFIDGQVDPHIWMDVGLFSEAIDGCVETLSKYRPEYSQRFSERGRELYERMQDVDEKIRNCLQEIPESKRRLVTSHDAFYYFVRAYFMKSDGIEKKSHEKQEAYKQFFAAPEGLAPDGQMSPLDIYEIVSYLQNNDVKVVFPELNLSRAALKKITSVLKAKGKTINLSSEPLYGDTLGEEGTKADSYLKMMHHNALTIHNNLCEKERVCNG